ncbi:MAG: 6,7-dimethyl-8-ribityllumazine synthase [Tannerella sp.]|jgi:6,7-dimethyl-8-ribityllumazine synthase|nr:6,7-dimethyl-8-ribityllumazine synthase [Tannerella sp.]
MATAFKVLSNNNPDTIPNAASMRLGIVVSEWNHQVTESLLEGACRTLIRNGVSPENIRVEWVPGSFELTFGARQMAEHLNIDAVIAIGCVVRGDTPHFDYICSSVTQGFTELNLKYDIPFIFGVLTTENMLQAEERAGGRYGNKGEETAITAIKMIDLYCRLKK